VLFLVNKMKVQCSENNVLSFNGLLREHLPEVRPVIKQLLRAGMITGIRGMFLEIKTEDNQDIIKSDIAMKKCKECKCFTKDAIGDGSGIGQCGVNRFPNRLIWPNSEGCIQYVAI